MLRTQSESVDEGQASEFCLDRNHRITSRASIEAGTLSNLLAGPDPSPRPQEAPACIAGSQTSTPGRRDQALLSPEPRAVSGRRRPAWEADIGRGPCVEVLL